MMKAKPSQRPRQAQRLRQATPAYVERAALAYLSRFSASEQHLREILWRKLQRRDWPEGTSQDEARGWIDAALSRLKDWGYLDDAAYARARARALLQRGKPVRTIAADLTARGVAGHQIEAALAALESGPEDELDLRSARRYLRRRFGAGPPDREKMLAVLARAGFSYAIARRALDEEAD